MGQMASYLWTASSHSGQLSPLLWREWVLTCFKTCLTWRYHKIDFNHVVKGAIALLLWFPIPFHLPIFLPHLSPLVSACQVAAVSKCSPPLISFPPSVHFLFLWPGKNCRSLKNRVNGEKVNNFRVFNMSLLKEMYLHHAWKVTYAELRKSVADIYICDSNLNI